MYTIENGYDKKHLETFMVPWHAQEASRERYRKFDFTLTTEWGDAWSDAGEGSTCKYRLVRDGRVTGVFQGLIRSKYFYSYMRAGSTSGNGLAIVTDDPERDSGIFLREILCREKRLSDYSIYAECAPLLAGVTVKPHHTFHIDLTKSLEEIFLSMHKNTRRDIRKARKRHVEVEVSRSTIALKETYALTASVSVEKGFLLPRLKWLECIHKQFSNCGDSISVLASCNGQLVSAGYFLGYDRKMNWIIGGSTSTGYKTDAGTLVQAKIIEWAKAIGYTVYDMGGTNPSDPTYAGIHAFKSNFGGKLVSNDLLRKKTLVGPLVSKLYTSYHSIRSINRAVKK